MLMLMVTLTVKQHHYTKLYLCPLLPQNVTSFLYDTYWLIS